MIILPVAIWRWGVNRRLLWLSLEVFHGEELVYMSVGRSEISGVLVYKRSCYYSSDSGFSMWACRHIYSCDFNWQRSVLFVCHATLFTLWQLILFWSSESEQRTRQYWHGFTLKHIPAWAHRNLTWVFLFFSFWFCFILIQQIFARLYGPSPLELQYCARKGTSTLCGPPLRR